MWAYKRWAYKGIGVSRVSRSSAMGIRWEARLTTGSRLNPARYPVTLRAGTRRGMRKLINFYLTEMK